MGAVGVVKCIEGKTGSAKIEVQILHHNVHRLQALKIYLRLHLCRRKSLKEVYLQ